MSTSLDPRTEYRRRMQHRQTVVIGSILTVMTVLTVVCMLIWTGVLPVPFDPGFSVAEKKEVTVPQPCPPADASTVEIASVPVNVYNGTDTAGLAKEVATGLTESGVSVSNTADWPRGKYEGDVLLTTSPAGVVNAYSLARAFGGKVLVTIEETAKVDDPTVNVVLGAQYKHELLSATEISQLKAGAAISAPATCVPATAAATAAPTA